MLWLCRGNPVAFVATSKVLNRLNEKAGGGEGNTPPVSDFKNLFFAVVQL